MSTEEILPTIKTEEKTKDKNFKKLSTILNPDKSITDIPNNNYGVFYPSKDEILVRRYLKENENMPVYKGAFKKVSKLKIINILLKCHKLLKIITNY